MSPGFALLENGEYKKAEHFFSNLLEENPSDKTANICFGRAVGLAGDPNKALDIFQTAEKLFPKDFELSLNIAEAYLWNQDPQSSLSLYTELIERDPQNFTACQGMANSHFKIGNYKEALVYVNKALLIDSTSESGRASKKYILLALADNLGKEQQFYSAISYLDNLLIEYPNDEQALINKGILLIQVESYKKAQDVLKQCIENHQESFEANIIMSHLSMLMHKDKAAIDYADSALSLVSKENKSSYLRAAIQKINALGAAKSFKQASKNLEVLKLEFGEELSLNLAAARLKVWDHNATDGLALYEAIPEAGYELYMGRAEAYIAMHKYSSAIEMIDSALLLRPESLDARKLKNQVIQSRKPSLVIDGNQSMDKGSNEANEIGVQLNVPVGDKHNFHLRTGLRSTKNPLLENEADQISIFVGDKINLGPRLNFGLNMGTILYENSEAISTVSYIGRLDLRYRIAKNHFTTLSYNRRSLTYSSDLIKSGVVDNKVSMEYQFTKAKLPGFYAASSKSFFSDGNENINLFSSLYYEIKAFPLIKLGINASYLSFKEDRSSLYFSPEAYSMGEVFVHVGNNYDQKKKLFYAAMFAYGLQKINDKAMENTTRLDLQLGYRLTSKLQLIVSYYTNTAATSTNKGYSFDRVACKINMAF